MKNLFEFNESENNKANVNKLAYVGSPVTKKKTGRDSDSWYTPKEYIESARVVLGTIGLDPFSSEIANEVIKAIKFHSEDDSSLGVEWKTNTVWMNPPYGPLCGSAIDKFIEQFTKNNFSEGIVLVNNATDTKWFKRLSEHASAWCFTDHRIQFYSCDGKSISGNTRGQVFIYFGNNVPKFKQEFRQHGLILKKV